MASGVEGFGFNVQCSISVMGNAASVEMAMDGYHEHDFTDYFQLLKVDGRWWIVSKLFHADPQSQ